MAVVINVSPKNIPTTPIPKFGSKEWDKMVKENREKREKECCETFKCWCYVSICCVVFIYLIVLIVTIVNKGFL